MKSHPSPKPMLAENHRSRPGPRAPLAKFKSCLESTVHVHNSGPEDSLNVNTDHMTDVLDTLLEEETEIVSDDELKISQKRAEVVRRVK